MTKYINCHPELVEGSQQNYISAHDIAENTKLNHEIAEELRRYKINRQLSSTGMTRIICLTLFTLLPTLAQAETCTATPNCKSLGYTETTCPDGGGVKCPWNTSLMYCCKKCAPSCEVKSCQIGDVLYSDKKCYTCLPNALPGQVPIGVVFSSGKAVALTDLSGTMTWYNANSSCYSYSAGDVSGWYLPTKDELLAMYSNRSSVVQGFSNARGGKDFVSNWYWSSSTYDYGYDPYWVVNPVNGGSDGWSYDHNTYVRPVLAF